MHKYRPSKACITAFDDSDDDLYDGPHPIPLSQRDRDEVDLGRKIREIYAHKMEM